MEETRASWVLRDGSKIPKKNTPSSISFSLEEVEKRGWIEESRQELVAVLRECNDFDKLQQIAGILGCPQDVNPWTP